jgi:cation diffusion facilitator family transporter
MKSHNVSLISVLTNIGLSASQITAGIAFSSASLVADGIHSGMDILSSFVAYLGTKIATKKKDESHPYGYYKSENLAGLVVTFLLFISGLVIIYEAYQVFIGDGPKVEVGPIAIIVAVLAVIFTEGLARFKFYFGEKNRSLALIADAEHSRADALSSVGVLVGLFASNYFPLADGFIAAGIGVYILYEAYKLGKEVTDSLLDVANKKMEEKIESIADSQDIDISKMRTRKIGSYNSAEIKIKLAPKLKVEEVEKIINSFENKLKSSIDELQYTSIEVESYDMERSMVNSSIGSKTTSKGFDKVGPEKEGERVVIPIKDKEGKEVAKKFGGEYYLSIDLKESKIVKEEIVRNPYFKKETPHGTKFIKAVRADRLVTSCMGESAQKSLDGLGVKVKIIEEENTEEIIKKFIKCLDQEKKEK